MSRFTVAIVILCLGFLPEDVSTRRYNPWLGKPKLCRCENENEVAVDVFTSTEGGAKKRTECMANPPVEGKRNRDWREVCYNICANDPCTGPPVKECISKSVENREKPGACPKIADPYQGTTRNWCREGNDWSCHGKKKCCKLNGIFGESYRCAEPVGTVSDSVNSGSCPSHTWQCDFQARVVDLTIPECTPDGNDCEVGHKCCPCPSRSASKSTYICQYPEM